MSDGCPYIGLSDYRHWLHPMCHQGEWWWTTTPPSDDDPRVRAAKDVLAHATAVLGGTAPAARYWLNGGWHVSANPRAVAPISVGDQHWDHWIPAASPDLEVLKRQYGGDQ